MSGSTGTMLAPVTRALGSSRAKRRQSDQRWEVTEADLNMYAMIVGRAPSDAEKVEAMQLARQKAEMREAREAEESERRAVGPSWSPAVLCSYLHSICAGAFPARVAGPQITGWVRNMSQQARLRLQETQARLASPRAR